MSVTKGIILAGGTGSRLYPATVAICKQLLPVYDKPLIYYPLATLMRAGIRTIQMITTPSDGEAFRKLFGDGGQIGLEMSYAVQPRPEGIAQAFLISERFIGGDSVALILGDNIFYGNDEFDRTFSRFGGGGLIFGYVVKDPRRYGVVEFDANDRVVSIEEKPVAPKSNYAVSGLYAYGPDVVEMSRRLRPSRRGELEITDLNRLYLDEGRLAVKKLGRGIAWLDTGTHESLLEAGNFIATLEKRQGMKVACIEEIALRRGYIDRAGMSKIISQMAATDYRRYLEDVMVEVDGGA